MLLIGGDGRAYHSPRTRADASKAKQHLTLHGGTDDKAMNAQLRAVGHITDVVNRSLRYVDASSSRHGRLHFQNLVFTKVSTFRTRWKMIQTVCPRSGLTSRSSIC